MKKAGIDLVEVSRFKKLVKVKDNAFLVKSFSKLERDYCFSFKDSAPHFAGMFAAKESVSKALGVNKYPFIEVEIRHLKDGAPVAFFKGKKLKVSVSISHTKGQAAAVAVA